MVHVEENGADRRKKNRNKEDEENKNKQKKGKKQRKKEDTGGNDKEQTEKKVSYWKETTMSCESKVSSDLRPASVMCHHKSARTWYDFRSDFLEKDACVLSEA